MKRHYINEKFFARWSSEMSYVLGYFAADGCIFVDGKRPGNPYTINITSVDRIHLYHIRSALGSTHKLYLKYSSNGGKAYCWSVRNRRLGADLLKRGMMPRKSANLLPIAVPKKYFPDFVRGYFDGDGTVYVYRVNDVPQIKVGFVGASKTFLDDINLRLCEALKIPKKTLHVLTSDHKLPKYSFDLYVDDSVKFARYIYHRGVELFLPRKYYVFKKWNSIKRRPYRKVSYPSKIGWRLRQIIEKGDRALRNGNTKKISSLAELIN